MSTDSLSTLYCRKSQLRRIQWGVFSYSYTAPSSVVRRVFVCCDLYIHFVPSTYTICILFSHFELYTFQVARMVSAHIDALPVSYQLTDAAKQPACFYRRSLPVPPAPTPVDWNRPHRRPFRESAYYCSEQQQREKPKILSYAFAALSEDALSDIPEESSCILKEEEMAAAWQDDINQIRQTTLLVLDEVKRLARELLDTEQRAQLWQDQYMRAREQLRALQEENAQLEMYMIASSSAGSETRLSQQQQPPRMRISSLVR